MGMTKMSGAAAALVVLLLGVIASQAIAGNSQGKWFQVALSTGETNGYNWSTGAKGPKGQRLRRICAEISMVEPPRNGTDVAEGRDSTDCGELKTASDAVVSEEFLGPEKSGLTVLEAIYRPLIQKVTIVFTGGRRSTLKTQTPTDRIGGAVPVFRYVATSFAVGNCVDRIVAFDGKGKVVVTQDNAPC
jgi:hypothetical protein